MRILVLGSGFAGLWAAVGAARRLAELGVGPDRVQVTVISAEPFHDIRVRNYEPDISACRIPLETVLDPVGIQHITARVEAIDTAARQVSLARLGAADLRPAGHRAGQRARPPAAARAGRIRLRRRHLCRRRPAERAPRGPAGPAADRGVLHRDRGRRRPDRNRGGLRDARQAGRRVRRARRLAAGAADRPQRQGRLRHGRVGPPGDRKSAWPQWESRL